jgi:CMP-N-acetylneuraminic acid synthetase
MPRRNEILAIVPARGGSKGIPKKNLVDVCGKPLIAWSIALGNELVASRVVKRSIISTDDEEIAAAARRHGGDVPFLRPKEIAGDTSKTIDAVLHALDVLDPKARLYDAVLLLQPTSPLRNAADIAAAISRFADAGAESLISCYEEDYVNEQVMYRERDDEHLVPTSPDHNTGAPRQDHGPTWVRNGAVYLTRSSYLREHGRFICDHPLLMKMRKSDSINVNSRDDLVLLKARLCGSVS